MATAQTIAEPATFHIFTNSPVPPLVERLQAARARTLMLASRLAGEQWLGPRLAIVNPPLWEFAHVAWFQEFWCLRYRSSGDCAPSIVAGADALYNSAVVPHATRWDIPLLPLDGAMHYLAGVLDRTLERLHAAPEDLALRYFAELSAAHEEMHCEAFTYTRQTLGYAAPYADTVANRAIAAYAGDASIPGGPFMLGAPHGHGFVFDNEKWAHRVTVKPFEIARAAVTCGEFAAFVDAGGYRQREFWCAEGWDWRERVDAQAPVYWVRDNGAWLQRRYDMLEPLSLDAAVIHINWYEADAWCRWAKRRLPTEAEWELAAASVPESGDKRVYPWGNEYPDATRANLHGVRGTVAAAAEFAAGDSAWGCRQMMGNVWEWTADWFNAYPGYVRDPYKEYSEPWFGNHKVLRGGCYATSAALLRNTWRNFYTPDRRDVLAGFRTCAV
jgi:gamma-glutamyl hercynylcysteine S-oxide synthase